ncbi:MAG: PAS domain S-box protein [Deltaproteobacteria bacterium]|nr:PAS domain S-box protein [Deltaproteobacteria bacterium]
MTGLPLLKRRTIASDLTIGIALTIIAVTAALSLLGYKVSVSRSERRLESRAEETVDRLAAALTLPLWNVDHRAVGMVADAYAQTRDVAGLRIQDETGAVIYEKRAPQESDPIVARRTVRYRDQEIGRVQAALTTKELVAAQKTALVSTLAVMACVTLAVIVVIRFLLRVFLRRPLEKLAQGLGTIASGSYGHRLPSGKQQDVDAIISDVNVMAAQIYERDQDLRESRKRYQELANLLPETVYETDGTGRFLFLSRSGFEAFGLSTEEFDRGLNVDDLFADEDLRRVHDDMERIMAGEPVGATEYTAVRKDGTRFPVLVHSSAIVREETIQGIRAIAVDITNRKRLEEELARLASGIAHQVRNPLMTIGGFALRLQKRYAGQDDPENWLHIILMEVQRLERMVADIHELTSLREAEPGRIAPEELVDPVLGDWRQRLGSQGIEVRRRIPDGLPAVTADQGLHGLAFEKILENAQEAMPDGGELEVRVHARQGWVCIVFADTGSGIPPKHLPHVFEPFYGSKPQASGLGLTMAQRIIHDHRGRIHVESSAVRGTEVEVCLPSVPSRTS